MLNNIHDSFFNRPDAKIGVWFLKRRENLISFIQDNPLLSRDILREIRNIEKTDIERIRLYLYNVSGMAPDKIDQIMKTVSPESKDIFEELRMKEIQEGIEKGMEKGIKEGMKSIALNMIARGDSDEQIAEVTNLNIKRIQALRKERSV